MNILPLAAALALALAAPALAGPARPVCRLVLDDLDDMHNGLHPSLDIESADLATNATHLAAVLRLAPAQQEAVLAPGTSYDFFFEAGGRWFVLRLDRLRDGDVAGVYQQHGPSVFLGFGTQRYTRLGTPAATYDAARREVRWTAPLSVFGGSVRRGTRLNTLYVTSAPAYGTATQPDTVRRTRGDEASGYDNVYVAGTPSCLAVRP